MTDATKATVATPFQPLPSAFATTGGLLRFTTAGNVDDGKSTLIGRLLYDTKSAYEDQIDSVRKSRINRSSGPIDFSLLTDGLRAEREQGITIDVAYRYFSTPRRKFIIADTPGHEQYTRNMVTGASTADAAIILIDVTHGVLPQSRRHAYIANLLGIRHLVFAVNKMDVIDYAEAMFRRTEAEVRKLARQLEVEDYYVVPISALEGNNVARRGHRMPWFSGPALLDYLETVPLDEGAEDAPFRLPVQYVIRPDRAFRGFAGQVASGRVSKGDQVIALPSGHKTRVRSLVTFDGEREDAQVGESIAVTLEDEIDLSRGDVLASERLLPNAARHIRASLVWMHPERLELEKLYLIKHTTRTARARVTRVAFRIDVETLAPLPATTIVLNDIAVVEIETTQPLFFDPYRRNRTMGGFILVDPISNATVAAGMIEGALTPATGSCETRGRVSAAERRRRSGHPPVAIWIDNEPLAERVERALFDEGWQVQLIRASEFRPTELLTAARVLHLGGMAAVFAASNTALENRRAIQKVFGAEAFFTNAGPDDVVPTLRAWRTAQTARAEKGKNDD